MYKRLVVGLFLALALGLAGNTLPVRAGTQDFTISSFEGDYYISRNADGVSIMRVRERIVAQFPPYDQNHGILRAIPESYENHSLELKVAGVYRQDGSTWQYDVSSENGNTVLKIGDPDAYVQGEQTYIIDYTVRGPVTAAGGQRLFWDVNGDQWPQSFSAVTARVHVPAELAGSLIGEPTCFTGTFGSNESACRGSVTDGGAGEVVYTVSTTRALQGYETLSVSVSFAAGTFAPYTMSAAEMWRIAAIAAGIVLPPLAVGWFVVRRWQKYGRDAKGKGVIVPQYLPPKDMSVLGGSAVLHQGFRPVAVSATIIDLAVRHYLKIYETGKKTFGGYKYDIELIKEPGGLRPEEQQVIAMLFDSPSPAVGARVSVENLSKKLYMKAEAIGRQVETHVTAQGYFAQKPYQSPHSIYSGGNSHDDLRRYFCAVYTGADSCGVNYSACGCGHGGDYRKGRGA